MNLSKKTEDLLLALDDLSGHTLTRRNDLGTLLELGAKGSSGDSLQKLSFQAKFIFKAQGLVKRAEQYDDRYANISSELTEAIKKSIDLINCLLTDAPPETRILFTTRYLELTPESLENLLALCHDLSWYKNRMIDHLAQKG